MRFHNPLNMNTKNVMLFLVIRSLYPESVSHFRNSSSLKWYSAKRIHLTSTFFSCLDTRKEGKRKSRPLPRPGKMAGYMIEIENVTRFAHSLFLEWHPVGRMQYAPTFFSCLDTRKEGKRKSRPPPRPGKLAGYMMNLKNGSRDRDEYKIHLKNVPGKTSLPR